MFIKLLAFVFFLVVMYSIEDYQALKRKYKGNFILEFGTLPLIITAPHGGWERPSSIPDRVRNGSLILQDLYTKEIAEDIYSEITRHYGQSPSVIVNLISRRKADPNRPLDEGTETEKGKKIWLDYHEHIRESIQALHKQHHYGLLIDIHGQKHKHGMVELGYLLTPDDIKTNDTETLKQYVLQKSSIQSLAHRYPKIEPRQLLSLLGDKISDRHEVPTMPSSEAEVDDVFYFFGAYTTETYHFHDEKNNKGLDAVQIEIPQKFRLTSEGRDQVVQAVSKAAIYFLDNYYLNKHKL